MKKCVALLLTLCLALCSFVSVSAAQDRDIVILYTNDMHCAVENEDGVSLAGLAAYKQQMLEDGSYVALVDAGDAIQGDAIGALTEGEYMVDLMNRLGYAAAVPGNHEFDYGMDRFLEITETEAQFPYVSANFTDLRTGGTVFDPYVMLTFGDTQVALVGICTPRTITSSTPAYFQDENGEFIYDFCRGGDGQALYTAVQESIDEAKAAGADYVIGLAHLGIEPSCSPWMSTEVIANTSGFDAVIDGHSHSVIPQQDCTDKDGNIVPLTSSGTKLFSIGKLTIGTDGTIATELVENYVPAEDASETVRAAYDDMQAYVSELQGDFSALLNTVVAKSEVDLLAQNREGTAWLVRSGETNLGDLCADAYRVMMDADVAIVNGGGIRANIYAGDVTYGDILEAHPFGNLLCVVEATGQQILDALEMGARAYPDITGGFQQVSGITFDLYGDIPSGVVLDENGMFVRVDGTYRVQNVQINGEPLELNKTYTLASHNYCLKNGGDGFSMFQGCNLIKDETMVDYEALIRYITETLGGVIGEEYANESGSGRIRFMRGTPQTGADEEETPDTPDDPATPETETPDGTQTPVTETPVIPATSAQAQDGIYTIAAILPVCAAALLVTARIRNRRGRKSTSR